MNTPIYDQLVAEQAEQHTTTVPFRRAAAPAKPAAAGKPRDWFDPAAPAPASTSQAAPPGFVDIAAIMARVSLDHAPAHSPAVTGLGGCYTSSSTISADAGACA